MLLKRETVARGREEGEERKKKDEEGGKKVAEFSGVNDELLFIK